MARQASPLGAHPVFQIDQKRQAPVAPGREPFVWRAAIHFALDVEQRVDALDRFQCQRRDRRGVFPPPSARRDVGEFEELPSRMRPTERFRYRARTSVGVVKAAVARIGVGLKDSAHIR